MFRSTTHRRLAVALMSALATTTMTAALFAQPVEEAPTSPQQPSPPTSSPETMRETPVDGPAEEAPPPRRQRWDDRRQPTADRLPYRDGKPVPPGYSVDIVPRRGMIAGGAALAGGLHMISMISAIALDAEADQVITDEQGGQRTDPEFSGRYTPLFIPLVGPFIAVKTSDANGTGSAILIMNGVAQVTGLSLVLSGLIATKKELVRDDAVSFTVAPLAAEGGGGVSLEGSF